MEQYPEIKKQMEQKPELIQYIEEAEKAGNAIHTARLFEATNSYRNRYYDVAILMNNTGDQAAAFMALDELLSRECGRIETNMFIHEIADVPPKVWYNTTDVKQLKRMIVAEVKTQLQALHKNISTYYPKHPDLDRTETVVLLLDLWENVDTRPEKHTKRKQSEKTFSELMKNDTDGRRLQKMHELMNGKIGKPAALVIWACVEVGWLDKPTFKQVQTEFGYIGAKSGFSAYLNTPKKFTDTETDGAIKALTE